MINKTETFQLATQHFEGLCNPSGEEIQLGALTLSTSQYFFPPPTPLSPIPSKDFCHMTSHTVDIIVFTPHITPCITDSFYSAPALLPPVELQKWLMVHFQVSQPIQGHMLPSEKLLSICFFPPFLYGNSVEPTLLPTKQVNSIIL